MSARLARFIGLSQFKPGAFGAELFATMALAWPLVITNLAQTGMTATDVLMMGHIGAEAVAAGALGTNLYFGLLIFGIGVMSAATPMIAVELGRNRFAVREIRRTFRQGLWASVVTVIPMWLILWQGEAILILFGQDRQLAHEAGIYLHYLQWSLLPFFLYLVMRSFFAAMQRTFESMLAVIVAFVFNIFANWCLMFGHLGFSPLGLKGSGIATSLSTCLMVALLTTVALRDRRFRRYHLFGRFWRADWRRWREFWAIGLPIGATLLFEVSIFNAAVFLMGLISTTALAAHAIAIQIASLSFMIPLGISQAATVRVGINYGAQNSDGIALSGFTAFLIAEGMMCLTALALIIAPTFFIGAFIDLGQIKNAPVVPLAISYLAIAALFQIADGAQVVGAGMLRGLHDTKIPMLYALLGYWGIGFPLAVMLGFFTPLSGVGIWLGLASGLAVVAVLMLRRWLNRQKLGLLATE